MTKGTISAFFTQFSNHLAQNFSRPIPKEQESIRNYGEKNRPIIRRLDSLARLIIKGNSENCVAVALVNNNWYFTANDAGAIKKNLKKIISSLKKIPLDGETIESVKAARDDLLNNYLKGFGDSGKGGRLRKDVKKILDSIKKGLFSLDAVNSLINKYKIFSNENRLHAEMHLVSSLVEKMKKKHKTYQIDLGISKLCCRFCASGLVAFKGCYEGIPIDYRGRHGNFYFAWKPPTEIKHTEFFKIFVGIRANTIYSNASNDEKLAIMVRLEDMNSYRTYLSKYFVSNRGGVTLNSDSPAPPNTESSEEISETESEDAWESSSDVESESSEEISATESKSEDAWKSSSDVESEPSEEISETESESENAWKSSSDKESESSEEIVEKRFKRSGKAASKGRGNTIHKK